MDKCQKTRLRRRDPEGERFTMPDEPTRRQKEKMLAGELYDPLDTELVRARNGHFGGLDIYSPTTSVQ
jgi:hypothetical protein